MVPRILLIDFDSSTGLAERLAAILETPDDRPVELVPASASELEEVGLFTLAERLRAAAIFLVLADRPAPLGDRTLRREGQTLPVFGVTTAEDSTRLRELLELGFTDFVRPPLCPGEVLTRLWRCLGHLRPEQALHNRIREKVALQRLIGKSPAFLEETRKIPLLARCDVGVLICGETGTGKEVVARTIHYLSPRSRASFVPVNCSAIPAELMENELFGHERGAFTSAGAARPGLVEEAEGGTLLLDEVDSLPLQAQAKLLRFLQEKEFRRLGSTRIRHGDVRVIAATNADVEAAVAAGRLRSDLYYRLNVVPLRLPPLRERREDILPLARHFLKRHARELSRTGRGFTDAALEQFLVHDWPGNVRELEHVVQRAVVLCDGDTHIGCRHALLPVSHGGSDRPSFREAKAKVIASFERSYLEKVLAVHNGNITRAARAAKKNRRAFFELIRKHEIEVQRFKLPD